MPADMHAAVFCCRVLLAFLTMGCLAAASHSAALRGPDEPCPRPAPGSEVEEPEDLRSRDGVLSVDLAARNEAQQDGSIRYCYRLPDGHQSPTLR
jgi:hypothetical protein